MLSEKPWHADEVLQLLVRLFASMFLGMVVVSLIQSAAGLPPGKLQLFTLIISIVSFQGIALLLTHLFLRARGISWPAAFGFAAPRLGRALLLALLVGLGVLPIAWSLAELSAKLMSLLRIKPVIQDPVQMLQTTGSVSMRALIGVMAVILAPFAEELIFRGLIYTTIKQRGLPRLALWGTSVFFAVVHHNLAVLLPLTFLAVVWTLLYETTGNLLAPILAHSLFNLVNFWVIAVPGFTPPGAPT